MESAGTVLHVLNRAVKRDLLFSTPQDYQAFLRVLAEARERIPLRIVAFCVMPNHWHLVVWPSEDGQVSSFMHWLTLTHATRWHASRGSAGHGAVYQGRFKSFPVQSDYHVLRVCRYVERNALRAGLVARAEDWRWGSLWHRMNGDPTRLLSAGPIDLTADWPQLVNEAQTPEEVEALRRCVARGVPYGSPSWTLRTASEWGLLDVLRPRGRPRKRPACDADAPSSADDSGVAK